MLHWRGFDAWRGHYVLWAQLSFAHHVVSLPQ
jgi:hypothetical protein